jgi:hypothetical protein
MERQAPNVGQMIVDIQLIRRAASEDPDLAPYKRMIRAAEERLASMDALKLVKALVAHSRLVGERLKI